MTTKGGFEPKTEPPANERDPGEWVRRIGEGHREAEDELINHFTRGLSLFLRRKVRDPALADDLHQETFCVVLTKAREGKIREPNRVAGFIRSTALNLYIAHLRKTTRYSSLDDESAPGIPHRSVSATPDQMSQLERTEAAEQVRQMLDELKFDRDRELLASFYLSEESKSEICSRLDIDPARFNKVLHRARRRLREIWEGREKRRKLLKPRRIKPKSLEWKGAE